MRRRRKRGTKTKKKEEKEERRRRRRKEEGEGGERGGGGGGEKKEKTLPFKWLPCSDAPRGMLFAKSQNFRVVISSRCYCSSVHIVIPCIL